MRRMKGFSLIELIVALGLGLLLSAAAIQLFLTNQITLNFQRGMNDIQANGRFAIDQIVHDARLAGLGPQVSAASATTSAMVGLPFAVADIPGLPAGSTAINSNDTADSAIGKSDQLVVQYLAMADTVDCEGNKVVKDQYLVARYFVRDDVDGTKALVCDGGNHNGVTLDTTSPDVSYANAGTVLLNGVDSFQVLYGVDDRIIDSKANGVARVARYVNAATYAALVDKPAILTIRLGLYLHSVDRAGDAKPPSNDVQVLDKQILKTAIPADDGFLRRLFITTISLRNVDLSGV